MDKLYGSYQITGLGPDAPTQVYDNGAKRSVNVYRFECLPPLATAHVALVLANGMKKYGRNNWLGLPPEDSEGRAIGHILAHLAGDEQEGDPLEHLAHAACNILFALDIYHRRRQEDRMSIESNVDGKGDSCDNVPVQPANKVGRVQDMSYEEAMKAIKIIASKLTPQK